MVPSERPSRARYRSLLSAQETEKAIKMIKDFFQNHLARELHLRRITAPFFVEAGTGINDDLSGVERPVSFSATSLNGVTLEVVQSLAKWKRLALRDLKIRPGDGIYTDMNAIRPDETLDALHSLYVDQWDWERVIGRVQRDLRFLKRIVRKIYAVIRRTEHFIHSHYPKIRPALPDDLVFVHAQDLEDRYPGLDPRLARQWMFLETGSISFTWEMTYHDAPYSSRRDAYIDPPRTFELGCALGRALGRFWK